MGIRNTAKIIGQIVILSGTLLYFLVLENGLGGEGVTISYAYPPPASTTSKSFATASAYPPPVNTQEPNKSSLNSAYPAPIVPTIPTANKLTNIVLPKDQIVAITNNGEVVDFSLDVSKFTGQTFSTNNSTFALPTFPKVRNNIAPMSIIGGDDRFKIQDTKVFPWTTVVKIEGHFTQNEVFSCTGWMLGQSTVVTAAHCIYDFGATNAFAFDVTFTPAFNTDDPNQRPFGGCQLFGASVLTPWFSNGDSTYDYGVYKLACKIGEQTGNLGFKNIQGDGIGTNVAATGYPGDKGGTTMWGAIGNITFSNSSSFFYNNDTSGGESGAPVWDFADPNCNVCVVAVHTNGTDSPEQMNHGPRVHGTAFNYFMSERQFIVKQVFLPMVLNQ
jgi:glutamyl endopeptidase